MKLLRNLCRILVGAVFIYSGFVKGVDLWGSTYKFIDYFNAFHLSGLNSAALVFAFLLALFEFTVGASLLLNIRTRWAAWGALLFMAVFTPLTFLLALTNPVSDCGCFGDALVLTNWQTFWKNIVLLALTVIVFRERKQFNSLFNYLEQSVIVLISLLFLLSIEFHCYRHLPILDFRPYAIGCNLSEGMNIPEGTPQKEYEITLQYRNKNTGEIQDFTEDNYPWQDTLNWEFVQSYEQLAEEGKDAPIHDFIIEHPLLGDITQDILQDPGYTFLAIAYNIHKTNPTPQEKLNALAAYARDNGYRFYGLSASSPEEIRNYASKHPVGYTFCGMDEIQLKTMIRSNPGVLLLHEGTVIAKWGWRDIPEVDEISNRNLAAYCLSAGQKESDRYMLYSLALLCAACIGFYLAKKYRKQRNKTY